MTGLPAAPPPACTGGPAPAAGQWDRPWVPASVLTTGATMTFGLSARPDPAWGSAAPSAPPSFPAGRLPAVGYSLPSGTLALAAGRPSTLTLGVKGISLGTPSVHWAVTGHAGLTVSATSGSLAASGRPGRGAPSCATPAPRTTDLTVSAASAGDYVLDISLSAGGTALPPVVVDVTVTG